MQDLVKEIDPNEQLDEDVEEVKYYLTTNRYRNQNNKWKINIFKMLLQVADDFIENVINNSCQLAKHRKSNLLEAKDVQFHLGLNFWISNNNQWKKLNVFFEERNFNISIPGFSSDDLKPHKKSYSTEAHRQVTCIFLTWRLIFYF